ncbi:hypothetical protein LJC45_02750 [Alistipes sp. OttesenSCG-928-B03]|nr:hypothetical protein [Alistipes sp. OttesenSCG-928-B03]
MITHTDIRLLLEKQPFVYLIDNWEQCAIKITKDDANKSGLRFWQKFKGQREFESHKDSQLVHNAIFESGGIVEDLHGGTRQQKPHTEIVTKEEYLRY